MLALLVVTLAAPTAVFTPEDAGRKLLRGEQACVRCHEGVAELWRASAHRFSSLDNPYYGASFDAFVTEMGPETANFCAGCHDPTLVANGLVDAKLGPDAPAARQGIGCLVCHSISETPDLAGNGLYHAKLTPVPTDERHAARVKPALMAEPTFCATCHKVGLTEEVTGAHWQRGQDEYDDWYDSAWAGRGVTAILRPPETKACIDCHMPEIAPPKPDKAAERDGKVRDHRFLAANTALPHLRGDTAQIEATRAFLRDVIEVDLRTAVPGRIDVVLRNHKVGHRFPGGTMDSNEVWLELTARDARGRVLRAHGHLAADGTLPEDAWRIRAQPVDADGRPLARRDVQHQLGVAYDLSLHPGAPRVARFKLPEGTAEVQARVLYRKFTPDYAKFACDRVPAGEARERCLTPPISEVATATTKVDTEGRVPDTDDWRRHVAHGLGLASGLSEHAAQARPVLEKAAALAPDRPEPVTALARLAAVQGRTDDVVALTDRLTDPPPAALWIRADALTRAFRHAPALEAIERLAARIPDDRLVLHRLAQLRALNDDHPGALAAADQLLTIDPEHAGAWYQRMLALRALGRPHAEAEATWLRHRPRDELSLPLRDAFRQNQPERAAQLLPIGPD